MNEQHKIDEAYFFLSKLGDLDILPREYAFELSAFLSAARSALQYALKEARTKDGGLEWYESQVSQYVVVKYLKDKRDLSIHREPVLPTRRVEIEESVHIYVSDSVEVEVRRADGTIERDPQPRFTPTIVMPPTLSSVTVTYRFTDWTGSEDVERLCYQYLANIELIVADGQSNGFLSP